MSASARFALGVVAAGAATWFLSAAARVVPWPIEDALGARVAFVLAFVWVSLEVLIVAWLARALPTRVAVGAVLLGSMGLLTLALTHSPVSTALAALVVTLLLAAGAGVGSLVGQRIEHVGHLGVVAIISSVADVASVFHESGPTAQLATHAPTLTLFAMGAPMLGTPDVPPILGVGDVVMASLYASAAHKFALSPRRTWAALGLGLASSMTAVLCLEAPLPALPFFGLAVLALHPETRLPPAHERRKAALGVTLVLVLVAWLFWRP